RIPKNARRAAFGHMNDYNSETRSWLGPIKFAQRQEMLEATRLRWTVNGYSGIGLQLPTKIK
ncbi:hypothetical protein, partial [Bradyrhizobium japonicum]|uniref:hypothetical protein n=1 Tax=Bradyrhizobium japonicum TaxID=375 RepID=UPI001AECEA15